MAARLEQATGQRKFCASMMGNPKPSNVEGTMQADAVV
jgi:hypothetical protein